MPAINDYRCGTLVLSPGGRHVTREVHVSRPCDSGLLPCGRKTELSALLLAAREMPRAQPGTENSENGKPSPKGGRYYLQSIQSNLYDRAIVADA